VSIGFLVTFLLGGLTGVLLASPPLDWHVNDSYFVVAHFHYVVFGHRRVRRLRRHLLLVPEDVRPDDGRAPRQAALLADVHRLPRHVPGAALARAEGMPRRYANYLASDGFTTLNTVSTIFSFILGASTIPFFYNVFKSWRYGRLALRDDPWGHGNSLEWATSSPPPRHNFTEIPKIRSERPAFEAHYPHLIDGCRRSARREAARALRRRTTWPHRTAAAGHADPDPT
jgi:cytochrome c oxidase subunit 1